MYLFSDLQFDIQIVKICCFQLVCLHIDRLNREMIYKGNDVKWNIHCSHLAKRKR